MPENSYLLANWEFAVGFSNCTNSPNFEAKINCNTSEPNVPKWKKTCTGLQLMWCSNLWWAVIYVDPGRSWKSERLEECESGRVLDWKSMR